MKKITFAKPLFASLLALFASACVTDELPEPGDELAEEPVAQAEDEFVLVCASFCNASNIIIGCDDRVVQNPATNGATTQPWSFTGRFDGANKCSGTLIGDKWVLTAAHCVDDLGASPLGFALGQEVQAFSGRPYGTATVRRVHYPRDFAQTNSEEDRALDYAVAELWSPIAGATPADFGYLSWGTISNKLARSVGYPADQPDDGFLGRPWSTTGKNFHNSQPFKWLGGGESGLLYTYQDASGGQSGSPVYVFHNGGRKVIGVLIGSPPNACFDGENWVARLTPGAVDHIDNLMAPNVFDFFWKTTNLPSVPSAAQGESWP